MKDFNIKLTVRSGRILEAIEEKFGTQSEMARQTDMHTARINAFVTMRQSPVGVKGWTRSAMDFAGALGVEPSEIWPDHMKEVKLKRSTAEFSLDMSEVKQIAADGRNPMLANLLCKASSGVPDRRLKAVRMHIEGATLDEIGAELGVGKQRASQIMMQGFKAMRQKLKALGVENVTEAMEATQ